MRAIFDDRRSDCVDQVIRNSFDHFRLFRIKNKGAGKLVAAQPCQQVFRRHDAGDTGCYLFQHNITGVVTVYIIDTFEIVEIQHHERDAFFASLRRIDQLCGFFFNCPAIEQSGQRIGYRERMGTLLGSGSFLDFIG